MLSRASPLLRKVGTRAFTGPEVAASFGNAVAPMVVLAGGIYVIDAKIESKTNHIDTKLDSLTQVVNGLSVSVARIEEHIRK